MSKSKDGKTGRVVVDIKGELAAKVVKTSIDKGISQAEALDLIAKGDQTVITTFFPNEFTKMIKDDLGGVDQNKRKLAYQEITQMADAQTSIHKMKEAEQGIELMKERQITEKSKRSLNAEREKTENAKQDYYRSRDIDSQDRKEIRRIAQEERKRLAEEKERGA